MTTPDFLSLPDRRLAYQQQSGRKEGAGMLFLGGYASDMTGTKAGFLAERCQEAGYAFTRFDYQGHGQSSGDFKDGTIGAWLDDALVVLDKLTAGPQIVAGSSMGGWLALWLAIKRPERVKALVGIAGAPDFTEDLVWLRLSPAQQQQLQSDGVIYENQASADHNPPLTWRLIEEGRQHLLLRRAIAVTCPVRLLQGMADTDVPWQHALRLVERLPESDVGLYLVKDGDHRLNRPQDLALLWRMAGEFL